MAVLQYYTSRESAKERARQFRRTVRTSVVWFRHRIQEEAWNIYIWREPFSYILTLCTPVLELVRSDSEVAMQIPHICIANYQLHLAWNQFDEIFFNCTSPNYHNEGAGVPWQPSCHYRLPNHWRLCLTCVPSFRVTLRHDQLNSAAGGLLGFTSLANSPKWCKKWLQLDQTWILLVHVQDFRHEDWVLHRSSWRYFRHIRSLFA